MENILLILSFIVATLGGYYPVKWVMLLFRDESLPVGFPRAGAWIGILERSLIWIFLLIDTPALIGFILTIKAIYRYGDIQGDNQEKMRLSEYFIIGTMCSLLWVLAVWYLSLKFKV